MENILKIPSGSNLGSEFSFHLPTRIVFGSGTLQNIGKQTRRLGSKAFLVTAKDTMREMGILDQVVQNLREEGVVFEIYEDVEPDPSTDTINQGAAVLRSFKADLVLGLGGGSAIDAAKGMAVAATHPCEDIWDYIIGGNPGSEAIGPETLPILAIPTTSGTGTETTMGSVIRNLSLGSKECLGSEYIAPALAIVDPDLSRSMPQDLTAATGLDALTQCIEAFVSVRSNPLSDALALHGIRLISKYLRVAVHHGDNLEARSALSLGAMISGMALSQAGVGAAHAISMVLGGRYGVQHGLGVSLFLADTIQFNAQSSPEKYALVAEAMGESIEGCTPGEAAELAVSAIHSLVHDVGLGGKLRDFAIPLSDLQEVSEAIVRHPDMGPNPAKLSANDVYQMLVDKH